MKTINIFKIILLYTFIYCNCIIANCQRIESIDSSEVYILSVFNYYTDSLNKDKIRDYQINTPNTLNVLILKEDDEIISEFQANLITGDNKYSYISKNDTFHLKYINLLIKKHFIANIFFQVPLFRYPLDFIDLSNSDSLIINNLIEIKKQPQIENYILTHYIDYLSFIDIVDNRLMNDLISVINGKSLKDSNLVIHEIKCPFIDTGTYYMLLKVKMVYFVINDEKEKLLGVFDPLVLPSYNNEFFICNLIPTKQIYHKKNSKNLLAIPLYVELLKPFNDINRIYMEK